MKLKPGISMVLLLAVSLIAVSGAAAFAAGGAYPFTIPSYLTTEGVDSLPSDPSAPGVNSQLVAIRNAQQGMNLFNSVQETMQDELGMYVEEPVNFHFVKSGDTSVLQGTYDVFNDVWGPFDRGAEAAQVSSLKYNRKLKQFDLYILENLEQSEAASWIAGLLGVAWFYEHSPRIDNRGDAEMFGGWVEYKISIMLGNYYIAKENLDDDFWPDFSKLLAIEKQNGEQGVLQWAISP
ncbi:MAG: hypothetical protein M1269_02175 [Chloroflexi bacterium]|nr:hypothetical protein [Chloroflexota bacterium]